MARDYKEIILSDIASSIDKKITNLQHYKQPYGASDIVFTLASIHNISALKENNIYTWEIRNIVKSKLSACINYLSTDYKYVSLFENWYNADETVEYTYYFTTGKISSRPIAHRSGDVDILMIDKPINSYLDYWS